MFFKNTAARVLMTSAGLIVFILGTTFSEKFAFWAQETACQTPGCARPYAFGMLISLGSIPVAVIIFSTILFLLLLLGFKLIKRKSLLRPLYITVLPFSITSPLFFVLTHLILEAGYMTDLRLLAFIVLKISLLLLDALILVLCVYFACQRNWKHTFIVSVPPILLFIAVLSVYLPDATRAYEQALANY